MDYKFFDLSKAAKDSFDKVTPQRVFVNPDMVKHITDAVEKELTDTNSTKDVETLRSIRNSVVKHFEEKRNPDIDHGRLDMDDWTRMSMIVTVIDNMIYIAGGQV